jgi:branched-subunit amino acid transport protein AzlD
MEIEEGSTDPNQKNLYLIFGSIKTSPRKLPYAKVIVEKPPQTLINIAKQREKCLPASLFAIVTMQCYIQLVGEPDCFVRLEPPQGFHPMTAIV